MKFKVVKYHGTSSQFYCCHDCVDDSGKEYRLDLTTDGSFPEYDVAEDKQGHLKSLVGKEIEVEYTHPYTPLHFACGVRVLSHTGKD